MASVTRPSWSRPWPGGTTARTSRSKTTRPGPVAEPGGHRGEHHHGVHGVLDPGHAGDPARHHPAVVEQHEHGLVALGPVGAHDGLAGAGRGRPVDAAELVVDGVLAQLVELGAAAATLRRAQADLEDAGPVDAQLGFVPAGGTAGRRAARAGATGR